MDALFYWSAHLYANEIHFYYESLLYAFDTDRAGRPSLLLLSGISWHYFCLFVLLNELHNGIV